MYVFLENKGKRGLRNAQPFVPQKFSLIANVQCTLNHHKNHFLFYEKYANGRLHILCKWMPIWFKLINPTKDLKCLIIHQYVSKYGSCKGIRLARLKHIVHGPLKGLAGVNTLVTLG